MRWYRLMRLACPTCGQKLVVDRQQVTGNDIVACQNCNTNILLAGKGQGRAARQQAADRLAPEGLVIVDVPG